jgi:predicted Zn-dependent protease
MTCTVIDGPSEDFDLEGMILVVAHNGETDPLRKTYTIRSYESYVVKDGKPERIIPLQISGGINQALSNIALLKDSTYQAGICTKVEPIYYPRPTGISQVPVSQFAKSQMWMNQQVYPLPISDVHLKVLT